MAAYARYSRDEAQRTGMWEESRNSQSPSTANTTPAVTASSRQRSPPLNRKWVPLDYTKPDPEPLSEPIWGVIPGLVSGLAEAPSGPHQNTPNQEKPRPRGRKADCPKKSDTMDSANDRKNIPPHLRNKNVPQSDTTASANDLKNIPPHLRNKSVPQSDTTASANDLKNIPPHLRNKSVPQSDTMDSANDHKSVPPHLHDQSVSPHLHNDSVPPHLRNTSVPPHLRNKNIPPHLRNGRNGPAQSPSPPQASKGSTTATRNDSKISNKTTPSSYVAPVMSSTHAGPSTHANGARRRPKVSTTASTNPFGQPEDEPEWMEFLESRKLRRQEMRQAFPRRSNRPPQPPRVKTVWAKNRDMRARPGDTEEDWGGVNVNDKGDNGGWPSEQSSDLDDPYYDVKKLVGWDGEWIPPPVDWDSRRPYNPRHLQKLIHAWVNEVHCAYNNSEVCGFVPIGHPAYAGMWTTGGDIVIPEWVPREIEEGTSAQNFWRSYPSRAPPPVEDDDLSNTKPWWENFSADYCVLANLDVPDAKLDPSVDSNNSPHALETTNDCVARKEKEMNKREDKREQRNRRVTYNITKVLVEIPDTGLKPKANFYIRPVLLSDAAQIAQLYNCYVEDVSTNEFTDRTPAQMLVRINNIKSGGLPWIVAVKKGKGKQKAQGHYQSPVVPETIIGFANMEDYVDAGAMCRFSYELEMYVNPDYLHQGIGKCMLDRMIDLCHPGYIAKGGYEWVVRDDYLRNGCTRLVRTINFNFYHEQTDDEKVKWVAEFMKKFGFRKAGHLWQMGFKHGKTVDITIFQMNTTETINANQRPNNPL